jgi:hypothetical protein
VFNATCNNISAISWWPALVVEEAGVPIDQEHLDRSRHTNCTGSGVHTSLNTSISVGNYYINGKFSRIFYCPLVISSMWYFNLISYHI